MTTKWSSRHSKTTTQLHDANYSLELMVLFQVEKYDGNSILGIARKFVLDGCGSVFIDGYDGRKIVRLILTLIGVVTFFVAPSSAMSYVTFWKCL